MFSRQQEYIQGPCGKNKHCAFCIPCLEVPDAVRYGGSGQELEECKTKARGLHGRTRHAQLRVGGSIIYRPRCHTLECAAH